MSTLKAILIDDEKGSLESLAFELREYCPEVEVIGSSQDPKEGLRLIQKLSPDVLVLDIEMVCEGASQNSGKTLPSAGVGPHLRDPFTVLTGQTSRRNSMAIRYPSSPRPVICLTTYLLT